MVGGILAGGSFFADRTYAAEVNPSNGTESVKPLCATCNQYKGYIKYSNILSHEYLGTVTRTSGWATNTGFTVYGISFGGGKTYSESRNFKEYRVKRQYYMHFDVYNPVGKKLILLKQRVLKQQLNMRELKERECLLKTLLLHCY
ncbi:LMxysn_1693 family intestinal colonization protein [Bacillus thuringiensis]|uniref:Uncharacterized protein n=1 Tax=Bacillus thuringiensis subsp. jegathesan TaxID=56955 RepID=A0A9X6MLH1_BACTJ|nr:hypothetical protein [Bacillus thuringiensis]OUB77080.1 hypothetical protein BK750_02745 [Bacillus thuringiensis serovar jegathesan]